MSLAVKGRPLLLRLPKWPQAVEEAYVKAKEVMNEVGDFFWGKKRCFSFVLGGNTLRKEEDI